nr:hypothetical protein CFP56_11434 [Quercus suber]
MGSMDLRRSRTQLSGPTLSNTVRSRCRLRYSAKHNAIQQTPVIMPRASSYRRCLFVLDPDPQLDGLPATGNHILHDAAPQLPPRLVHRQQVTLIQQLVLVHARVLLPHWHIHLAALRHIQRHPLPQRHARRKRRGRRIDPSSSFCLQPSRSPRRQRLRDMPEQQVLHAAADGHQLRPQRLGDEAGARGARLAMAQRQRQHAVREPGLLEALALRGARRRLVRVPPALGQEPDPLAAVPAHDHARAREVEDGDARADRQVRAREAGIEGCGGPRRHGLWLGVRGSDERRLPGSRGWEPWEAGIGKPGGFQVEGWELGPPLASLYLEEM